MFPHDELRGNHHRKTLRPAENPLSDGVQKGRVSPVLAPQIRDGGRVVGEDRHRGTDEMWSKPQESSFDGQELSRIDRELDFLRSPKVGSDLFV